MSASTILFIMFGAFIVMLLAQVPIAVSLGFATLIYCVLSGTMNPTILGTTLFSACDSFPLMAVPLFMLAGALIESGGLAHKLVGFATSIVGNMTGGYAMALIVTCAFFGSISGSSLATVAAIGSIMLPIMLANGYSKQFTIGLICASGCLGMIIPPSIPMVMYASATNASIGKLFLGGFGPGVVYAACLMVVVFILCKKQNIKGNGVKFSFRNVGRSMVSAVWALMVPVIILGGIYGGFFTPTEAAAVSCIYAAIIGKVVYKELNLKRFIAAFESTVVTTATIMLVCAMATSFGKALSIAQVPNMISAAVQSVTSNKILLLLLINLILVVVGCILDLAPAILIFAPIFMPILAAFNIDPVHFGLIMVLNLSIGLCTPPVGGNLFVATGISGLPFVEVVRAVAPFLIVMFIALMLVTYFPAITMFLPNLALS